MHRLKSVFSKKTQNIFVYNIDKKEFDTIINNKRRYTIKKDQFKSRPRAGDILKLECDDGNIVKAEITYVSSNKETKEYLYDRYLIIEFKLIPREPWEKLEFRKYCESVHCAYGGLNGCGMDRPYANPPDKPNAYFDNGKPSCGDMRSLDDGH